MGIIQTTKELRPREENDHYPTPRELVKAILTEKYIDGLCQSAGTTHLNVLDPGAGNGVWGDVLHYVAPLATIVGVERRKVPVPLHYSSWYNEDFTLWSEHQPTYHLIAGNPPYRYAEQFVRIGHSLLSESGEMVFLLRLCFLEGQKRSVGLWKEMRPYRAQVLNRRPSFTGNRKTDATAYMVAYWRKGFVGQTTLDWLEWSYE